MFSNPQCILTLAIILLTLFSSMLFILYSSDEGWFPTFHMLFFIPLVLISFWSVTSVLSYKFISGFIPDLKHFVNAFLLSLGCTSYFVISFLMYVVEEKERISD